MEWIKVSERIPKENGKFPSDSVLVCTSKGTILLGYSHKGCMKGSCSYCQDDDEIIYWMPLPTAPNL